MDKQNDSTKDKKDLQDKLPDKCQDLTGSWEDKLKKQLNSSFWLKSSVQRENEIHLAEDEQDFNYHGEDLEAYINKTEHPGEE